MHEATSGHLRDVIRTLEGVGEVQLAALAGEAIAVAGNAHGPLTAAFPLLLSGPASAMAPMLGPALEPSRLQDSLAGGMLAGMAMLTRVARRTTVTVVLSDGRAWQADFTAAGQLSASRFDDAVNDADAQALRRVLGLELVTALPGELACALWAHACFRVPMSRPFQEHVALTDPLPLLVDAALHRAAGARERHDVLLARAREGREWLDLAEAGRALSEGTDLLAVFTMRSLGLPAGFGRGERDGVLLGRLRAQLPPDPLDRAHPGAGFLARLAAVRLHAWGEPLADWLLDAL